MVLAVQHVLFTRPQQFYRRARHLLGDCHRLPDVVGHAAAAETAAEHVFVHFALFGRQARSFQHRSKRRFAVLRAAPDLAFVRGIERRGIQRLHRGVVLEWIIVDRLDLLRRSGNGSLGVAVLVADIGRLGVVETLSEPLRNRLAGNFCVVAFVPDDRQRVERGFGVPPGIGNDGDRRVADLHHFLDVSS